MALRLWAENGMCWIALLVMALVGQEALAANVESGQGGQQIQQPASPLIGVADEAHLKERVLARWQALIKGDFEAAYQFETPAYRAIYTPDQFRYQFGNQTLWRMANVVNIHYDNSIVARVQVEVAYRYAQPGMGQAMRDMTQQVNEIWLRKEGEWWRQQD